MPASAIEVDTSPTARTAVFIGGVGPHYAMLADAAVHRQLVNAGVTGLYQHANGNASLTPAQRSALWTTWHVGQPGNLGTIAEIGASSAGDPGYLAFFGGSYPAQVNMNSLEDDADKGSYTAAAGDAHPGKVYRLITSPAGLLRMQRAIDQAHAHGAKDVAVFITPNGGFEDLDDRFATSAYWATVRTAASYGGGIAIDTPPSYWVARGPGYQSFIVQMVEWANAKGLRSSVTVSPYALTADASGHSGGCGFDPGFHDNTKLLVSMLRKDHRHARAVGGRELWLGRHRLRYGKRCAGR